MNTNLMEYLFPQGIIPCATSVNDKACTIADIFILAQNFVKFLLVVVVPGILIIMIPYLVIQMVTLGDRPAVRQKVYRSVWYLFVGLFFTFGAYVAMSLVINALGFKAEGSPIKGVLQSFDSSFVTTAYAQVAPAPAPNTPAQVSVKLQNPLDYSQIQDVLYGIGNAFVFLAIIGVVFAFVRSGFLFLGSNNNPERHKKAIFWLMVGTIAAFVIFGLQAIIEVTINTFQSAGGK